MKASISIQQILIFAILASIIIIFNTPALAASAQGGNLPYEAWLTKLAKSLTGPVAYSGSLIGIVSAGLGLIFGGELNAFFRTIIFIVFVMSLLVGASAFLSFFGAGAEFL